MQSGQALDDRPAVYAHGRASAALLALLLAVMARLAEALRVVRVEEQLKIATVRGDVVRHGRRCYAASSLAEPTERLALQRAVTQSARRAPG